MYTKGRVICKCCRRKFEQRYYFEEVCQSCAAALPKCDSCHTTMGRIYGFMEDFAKKVGKYSICTACVVELKKRKFLIPEDGRFMLSSGQVVSELPKLQ